MVGKLYIYAKDGSTRCVLNKWEFYDTFMGEQYLQFDKESAVQIDFEVGDYAIYRDERFEINVKPTCEQVSRPESGGVAFKYQSVKMDSLKNELTKCSLLDITPTTYQYVSSEGTNYTGSTNFTMYCIETTVTMKKSDGTTVNVLLHPVEYLCGVIQANLDRLYGRENGWQILVNPEAEKSDDVVLNVSNWSCEQALAEVHNTFKLDYEVRGRTIRVGYSLQNITGLSNDAFRFGYGKGYAQHGDDGHSLISVKRTSNSSQQIVTRLRVMGSAKNMPYRYYNKKYDLPQSLFVENLQLPNTYVGTGIKYDVPGLRKVMGDTNDAYIEKDDDAASSEEGVVEGFAAWDGSNSDLKEIYPTIKEATYYELRRADGVTDIDGIGGTTAFPHYGDDERIDQILSVGSTCNFGSGIMPEADVVGETGETKDVTYSTSLNSSQFHTNGSVYIGPQLHICSFERMYLPGKYTLSMTNENVFAEFGKVAGYDPGYQISIWLGSVVGGKDTLLYYYNKRGKNSALTQRDKVQIDNLPVGASDSIELTTEGYISVYIEPLYFKRANDPFIFTGMPFGIVSDQAEVEPHMIWNYLDAADTFVNTPFNIVLKDLGFDIRTLEKATDDTPKIHVNTGACAGRDFEISLSDAEVVVVGNKKGWNVRVVARNIDNSIKRYFPSENDPLVAGDDYVITGIAMPDAYIKMAEVRLLRAATDYLADNCDTKYVYEPQIDSVYVQRNYDNNVAAGTPEKSVYMNLYAGLKFSMYGLPIAGGYEIIDNVTIQSVNIKEGESNVPSVEIVLNNDIDQTTIEKITTSVDRIYGSIFGKNANVLSSAQTNATLISLINKEGSKHFLSKEANDEAQGFIGFVKGIWIKAKELFGFDGEGNIKANNVDAAGDVEVGGLLTALRQVVNNAQSTNYVGGELAGTGWKLTNDNGEGNSRLEVDEVVARMRIVASVLEARQYCALGGNYVFSPAASIIDRVDYLNDIDSGSFVPDIYYGAGLYVTNSSFTIPAGVTIYLSNEAGYDDISLTDENFHIIVSSTSGTLSYTAEEDTVVKVMTAGQPTVTYKIYQVMGYEEVKVPWLLRKMPLWARNAVSARYKKVHMFSPDFDPSAATKYRCWIKADDGTTKTINTWRVGMLARCQTLDVEVSPGGTHAQTYYDNEVDEVTAHKNKFYWREVYAVGTGRLPIDDGYDHHYVDLSNETNHFYTGSDIPSAGDSIVCFGDRLNQETSHLIIIETVGEDAPAIKEYKSVGYVDGTSINWSLTGKMRTCISPTSGNIFVAPRFIVEIAEDDRRDLATFVVDTDGMRSTVKSSAGNRNLFSFKACTFGVATNDCGYPAVQSYGMLLRFAGDTDTTGRLARVRIPSLEVGKTYTLSCQIRMTGSVGAPEKTHIEIDLGDTHSGMKTIEVTTSWQTIEVPLLLNNTSNPEYKWIDFGIYGDDYVAGNYALLRHIKLEEGGMATAFTVANEDANYVTNVRPVDEWLLNANIAEDSTITCPSGKKVYKTLAMPSAPSGQADEYIDYITANGLTTIEVGKVYTISYWVKSSANNTHRMKTYMYPDLTPVLQDFMALVGDDGQTERIATDYETEVGVTTEWKKHYIHVYVMSLPSNGIVSCIPLRLTRTAGSTLNTTGTLYISDVQLCEGYVSDNNTTVNESYSEIKQTADAITQRVQSVEDDVDGLTVDVAELEMTADSITSEVKQLHKGKNMLSGVLDGTGWRSANSSETPQAITKNVVDNWIEHNNLDVYVISPDVSIKKDTKYTFSFDVGSYITTAVNVYVKNGSGAPTPISLVDEQGRAITQPMTTGISGRRSVTFVPVANATAMIYVEVDKIHFPQLETGNTATAFEAPSSDTISQIKQTANSIEAKVNNTGVDITNGLIRLEGGKVEIEESVEVPTVLSMNDYMYTQIQAGSVEIRSKNSASFGLFQINALNEIVLTMYDKDGNCVVNLGGSQNATTYGGWQEMKLKAVDPTVTIGGLSEFTNNGNGESTWRLMLGKLTNSASVLQYFTPSGNETVNSGVKGRDNCVFTSKTGTYPQTQQGTSDEETAINTLTPISSGYYVFPNNGIFMQDMLGTYVVMIYRYNSDGRLVQTIKHEFTN